MIPMPPRHSVNERVVRAASRCLRQACARHYPSTEIGAVAQILSGGTPDTQDPALWDGNVVWITPKDLGQQRDIEITTSDRRIAKEAAARLLPVGAVLLSSRAPIGHLGIAALPLCTNQGFKNIICSDALDNRYLFHTLRASIENLDGLGRGNTFKEIPAKTVASFVIPLPPPEVQRSVAAFLDSLYLRQAGKAAALPELPEPIGEQRGIVARIEAVAAKIEEARALRHRAAEEAEALLASCRRATFGESIQEGWVPLSDYVAHIENGKSPATDGRRASPDEWGVLKVGAVSFGVFDDRENKALPLSFVVPPHLEVRPGDFIMSRANTTELVGACALVRETRPKLILSDKTFRFVFRKSPIILPEYLEQVLKSAPLREQIEHGASGTSPTMKNISKEKVLALRLPPLELPVQRRIVLELGALQAKVDTLKRLQAETAAELDALVPSILDRAFKGEL